MSVDLRIESGLDYIASQNRIECFYDAMQNIFLNADGFREIFAYKAQELANGPYRQAFMENQINAELCKEKPSPLCAQILRMLGLRDLPPNDGGYKHYFSAFFDLIVAGMRRYVLIKLLEQGRTEDEIKSIFGIKTLQTYCGWQAPARFRTWYISGRRPSINRTAGTNISLAFTSTKRSLDKLNGGESTAFVVPNYKSGFPTPSVGFSHRALELFLNTIMTIPLLSERFEIKSFSFNTVSKVFGYFSVPGFETIYSNIDSLVAIYYNLEKYAYWRRDAPPFVHKVAIVRYHGEYYYCDNELGRAIPIDRAVFLANCNNTLTIMEERVWGSLGGPDIMDNIVEYKVTLGPATIYEASKPIPTNSKRVLLKYTLNTQSAYYFIQKASSAAAGGGGGGGGAAGGARRRRRQTRKKN